MMLRIDAGSSGKYCDGFNRRSFLQVGMAGMGAASLGSLMQARDASASSVSSKKQTAVILLWLDGGPSHDLLFVS